MITVFVFNSRTRPATKTKVAARKAANNPMVNFLYPQSKNPWIVQERFVRLISANGKYLLGLEVMAGEGGKQKYAFKKFLQSKVTGMKVVEFAPVSMSK